MISAYRVHRDKQAWATLSGHVLATWHIFNPNGPTINCIGLADTAEPSIKEVFYRWLHFLHDESYALGFIDVDGDCTELVPIVRDALLNQPSPLLPDLRMVTCVPSLITLCESDTFNLGMRESMIQCPAVQGADWGRELYYLEKYGVTLFDRAGEEIRESLEKLQAPSPEAVESQNEFLKMAHIRYGHIPTFSDWAPGRYSSAPFTKDLAEQWFSRVSDLDFAIPGLAHLADAWVGAQDMVKDRLPAVTTLDDVKEFFERFDHPLFHKSTTAASVAIRLGLRSMLPLQ